MEPMVGPSPKIRFWDERLILIAQTQTHSRVLHVSFPIGEVVQHLARPEDTLYVARSIGGGLGMSIVRDGELVLALGSVSSVPLGENSIVENPRFSNPDSLAPVKLRIGDEHTTGDDHDCFQLAGYDVFIEHCARLGTPVRKDECVSISRIRDGVLAHAVRAVALLAHVGATWTDLDHHCHPLPTYRPHTS